MNIHNRLKELLKHVSVLGFGMCVYVCMNIHDRLKEILKHVSVLGFDLACAYMYA